MLQGTDTAVPCQNFQHVKDDTSLMNKFQLAIFGPLQILKMSKKGSVFALYLQNVSSLEELPA